MKIKWVMWCDRMFSSCTLSVLMGSRWEGQEGIRASPTGHPDVAPGALLPAGWGGLLNNTQGWHRQGFQDALSQGGSWALSPELKLSPFHCGLGWPLEVLEPSWLFSPLQREQKPTWSIGFLGPVLCWPLFKMWHYLLFLSLKLQSTCSL